MTMKFVNAEGKTDYAGIGTVSVAAGEWGEIKNDAFTIPEGASDMMIYIETPNNTCDFYVDEAFSGPEGTDPTTGTEVLPTKAPTKVPTKTPTRVPEKRRIRYADLDLDGAASLAFLVR
jgi:hypothetical protein